MDKASKKRWAIWLLLLAVTVAAIFAPGPEEEQASIAKPRDSAQKKTELAQTASAASAASADEYDEADPFAPRGWEPPPPPPPPAPKQVVVQRQEPAAPVVVSAPPLPFNYMGQLNDGGEQVVYLGRGEQLILVRAEDTVEGVYKVLKMSANEIEFLHLPTGEKQILNMNTARP